MTVQYRWDLSDRILVTEYSGWFKLDDLNHDIKKFSRNTSHVSLRWIIDITEAICPRGILDGTYKPATKLCIVPSHIETISFVIPSAHEHPITQIIQEQFIDPDYLPILDFFDTCSEAYDYLSFTGSSARLTG